MIRHADPAADAQACADIYAPFVRDTAVSFEEEPPTAGEFARRIEEVSRSHPWLLAERDGEPAGFAYAAPHHSRAAYRWAADVAVYVAGRHQRRGVGRELYLGLFELLRRQGLHSACAGITLPNEASVALHEGLGFAPVGVYRAIGWKAGAWRDVGWWQLELVDRGPGAPAEPSAPARLDKANGGRG